METEVFYRGKIIPCKALEGRRSRFAGLEVERATQERIELSLGKVLRSGNIVNDAITSEKSNNFRSFTFAPPDRRSEYSFFDINLIVKMIFAGDGPLCFGRNSTVQRTGPEIYPKLFHPQTGGQESTAVEHEITSANQN